VGIEPKLLPGQLGFSHFLENDAVAYATTGMAEQFFLS